MPTDHVDVVIVGAGLSGIAAACHLRRRCPEKTFAIVESRGAIGGTWDFFRYPGVRSDSDMFTLGYSFRPWTGPRAVADGASILEYIRQTAREYNLEERILFHHHVVAAWWSSEDARWTIEARRSATAETVLLTSSFLFVCAGYYRYDQGYTPHFDGVERFTGHIVHPQRWPEDFDYVDKRVIVIGSGATAVTLVPAIAGEAAHVTMVQRSPSYVVSIPSQDRFADWLRRRLPANAAYLIARWKNVILATLFFQLSRRRPALMKALIRRGVKDRLPEGYDAATHFAPRYDPWDQRLCLAPDGDLFEAISSGRASVVTDRIKTFTQKGLMLASGAELEADIVVTATGLNVVALGGIRLTVDGSDIDVAKTVAYKGTMLSGVPNFAIALGYTNASWTLKCELVCQYVCRLLHHMDQRGYRACTPLAPEASQLKPIIDLTSSYVLRSLAALPKQGSSPPWRLHQNYPRDVMLLRHGSLDDEGMRFTPAG